MKDQPPNTAEFGRLYKQVEGKLETIVERLLRSKLNENDNILLNVQTMTERIFIAEAMKITQNNISQASKLLGINRNTLSKKIREFEQNSQTTYPAMRSPT
jgi:DNA-binding protein Fis